MHIRPCSVLLLTLSAVSAAIDAAPEFDLPRRALTPAEIAVVINEDDAQSRALGAYYQQQRGIPKANVIRVHTKPWGVIDAAEGKALVDSVWTQTPAGVQAYALAWTMPYAIGCMSATSAFATRYDTRYCATQTCAPTRQSPYYDSPSTRPLDDHGLRPAMLLAGADLAQAKQLVDRGIAADDTWPQGTAYLVSTSDRARNVRARGYPAIERALARMLSVRTVMSDALRQRKDVLFYFTGVPWVQDLHTNHFLPGAVGDHLTSAGGALANVAQMTVLRWLEAGVTGSYGTVKEPCAYPQKFPDPGVMMAHYAGGESLLEAYWKSVAWPAEGLFVGEPLARPFGGYKTAPHGGGLTLTTHALAPGNYRLEAAPNKGGSYRFERSFSVTGYGRYTLELTAPLAARYRISADGRQKIP